MGKKINKIVKDFCKVAYMNDNSEAELPNVQPGLEMFMGNKELIKYMEGWDFGKWDVLNDISIVSPELLAYIVIMSKYYWEKVDKNKKMG